MRVPRLSPCSNSGATLIEAALVFPLLLILIFAVIDLSRYWGVQGVISQGAQRGVDIAIKTQGLDFDLSTAHAPATGNAPADPGYDAYVSFIKARTSVIDQAERLPRATLVRTWDSGSNSSKFLGFPDYQVFRNGAIRPNETVNAILIRPGEAFQDTEGHLHFHPTVCPPTTDPNNGACLAQMSGSRSLNPSDTMTSLIQTDPLVIDMPVIFSPILPIPLPAMFRPKGIAGGYHEILTNGAYPIPPEDVLRTPTPTPGPTQEPTDTPTITYTATPTPAICTPACDSEEVRQACQAQDAMCAVCSSAGACVCTNDCSGQG